MHSESRNVDTDIIRICLIGAGRHASSHIYPCLPVLSGATAAANCDLDISKARKIAGSYGIPRSYTDYHKMLKHEKPDGVVVCVGPAFHAEVAVELMTQGFHVYTEKPPGLSYADVLRVLETERKTNKTCMTAFKKRFAPAYIKTKELVWSEEFGNPSALSIFRTSGPYKGGGEAYLLDSAIHVVDLADFLFGRVSSVTTLKSEPANYAVGLEFLGGGVGTLTLTDRLSYERGWEAVHAVGSGGVVVHVDNSVEMIAFQYGRPIAAHKPEFVAGTSNSLVEMGFVGELQAFVDAIRNATRPESSIENAARAMAVLDAVKKATASGRREKVDEV